MKLIKKCSESFFSIDVYMENHETFCSIFKYLYNKYNFQPNTLNIDCNNAEIIAVKKVFINTKLIICYYHLMKRLV